MLDFAVGESQGQNRCGRDRERLPGPNAALLEARAWTRSTAPPFSVIRVTDQRTSAKLEDGTHGDVDHKGDPAVQHEHAAEQQASKRPVVPSVNRRFGSACFHVLPVSVFRGKGCRQSQAPGQTAAGLCPSPEVARVPWLPVGFGHQTPALPLVFAICKSLERGVSAFAGMEIIPMPVEGTRDRGETDDAATKGSMDCPNGRPLVGGALDADRSRCRDRFASVAPVNIDPPTITGTARVGEVLTAHNGTWDNTPTSYRYRWLRCNRDGNSCVLLAADGETYRLAQADVGARCAFVSLR